MAWSLRPCAWLPEATRPFLGIPCVRGTFISRSLQALLLIPLSFIKCLLRAFRHTVLEVWDEMLKKATCSMCLGVYGPVRELSVNGILRQTKSLEVEKHASIEVRQWEHNIGSNEVGRECGPKKEFWSEVKRSDMQLPRSMWEGAPRSQGRVTILKLWDRRECDISEGQKIEVVAQEGMSISIR